LGKLASLLTVGKLEEGVPTPWTPGEEGGANASSVKNYSIGKQKDE